ncbi:hypothetical protein GTA08_BOTSDO05346 [Neofusicoccum parvum]|nr:hypothetical protein GTA08_BOTSDO05346 [Neofusicoccum parvum]
MSRSNSSNTAVNTTIPAYAPSFNPAFMPFFFPAAPYGYPQAQPRPFSVPAPASNNTNNTNNTAQAEIAELRKMLEKIHMEQRDLEREMVIRENALTTEERQNMVEQKVQMINESDRIRKDIKRIESDEPSGPASFEQQKPAFPQPPGLVAPQSGPQPSLNPYMFANGPHAFVPFAPGGQFPSPYMLPSIVPFSGFTSLDGASSTPGGEGTASVGDNATKPTKEYKDKQEMQINQENSENPEKSEKPASHEDHKQKISLRSNKPSIHTAEEDKIGN